MRVAGARLAVLPGRAGVRVAGAQHVFGPRRLRTVAVVDDAFVRLRADHLRALRAAAARVRAVRPVGVDPAELQLPVTCRVLVGNRELKLNPGILGLKQQLKMIKQNRHYVIMNMV